MNSRALLLRNRTGVLMTNIVAATLMFRGSAAFLLRTSLTYDSATILPLVRTTLRLFSSADIEKSSLSSSPVTPADPPPIDQAAPGADVPLLLSEGIFAVYKPLDWTSSDVVSYIRGILERDARSRGATPAKVGSRRNKSRVIKVGHGGTLDPLATGVLVVAVGKATKKLQGFLTGSKRYRAGAELGFETITLDMEGNVTKTAPYDHVTPQDLEDALVHFRGKIQQIPPIFSAIRKDGKKLYEEARRGLTTDDIDIPPREVEILELTLLDHKLPKFDIDVKCGGGTYIRSLVRDIGYKVGSVATTTYLERTQQGQFTLDDCVQKSDWNADNIYAAIERCNAQQRREGEN